MKIAIGADHRGTEAASNLIEMLSREGHQIVHAGQCDARQCDYPDIAYPVAQSVVSGEAEAGILICGTGIGMSIAANKVPGIRAALVHDEIGADISRRHNDANVLCLSADMLGQRIIDRIVQTWLKTAFEGGRHDRRNRKVAAIEQGMDPRDVNDEAVDTGDQSAPAA